MATKTIVETLGGYTFTHTMEVTTNDIFTTVKVTDSEDEDVIKHVGSRPTGR